MVSLIERELSGLEYLRAVTSLLQRIRIAHPTFGVWEAADLQWWWRRPRPTDDGPQLFWSDDQGEPVAAVIATDWGGRLGVDLIHTPDLDDTRRRTIWGRAGQVIVEPAAGPIEVMVADDDALMVSLLGEDGFDPLPDTGTSAWMQADQRPPASVPPDGYRLLDRTRLMDRPHHFADRNGPLVETRLGQTSLYDPTLDLAMVDRTGQPVSYGLFWYDETTRVGFVEPLGTNDGHRRLGLARHVLTAGVDRLARAGATRIKINWENGNRSAIRIYTEIGFEPTTTTSIFTRAAPAG